MRAKQGTGRPLLWHYTDFGGLYGIVRERKIWASSLLYLNDATEFAYTYDMVKAAFAKVLGGLSQEQYPWTHAAADLLEEIISEQFWSDGSVLMVSCFSESRDDLSQWRGYANKPPGFAIGFHPLRLLEWPEDAGVYLAQCSYDVSRQRREVQSIVSKFLHQAKVAEDDKRKRSGGELSRKEAEKILLGHVGDFGDRLRAIASINKHPKFASEKEFRLVCWSERSNGSVLTETRFRQSGSLIVPYVGVTLAPPDKPLPIETVMVGPCPHQFAVIRSVRLMLERHGSPAAVIPSSVPFRNW